MKRLTSIPCWLAGFCLAAILSGCGEQSGDSLSPKFSGTASAVFTVQWHSGQSIPDSTETVSIQAVECGKAGITTVTCRVYDESNAYLTESGPWPCETHGGRVEDIPSGDNRTFVILGSDADGATLYQGRMTGVRISPGEVNDAGIIDAHPFVPSLATLKNGEIVDAGTVSLRWNSVPNAHEYHLQISDDTGFTAPLIIDITTTDTAYNPPSLSEATTYYWKVNAVDIHENHGIASTVGSFTTNDTSVQIPTATITAPANGSTFEPGDTITFTGTGFDAQGAPITGTSLVWTSSIDSRIGTGNSISIENLSLGSHTITLEATDSSGASGTDSIGIVVRDLTAPTIPAELTARPLGGSRIDLSWSESTDNIGVAGYRINRDGTEVGTATSTTYSDTGLASTTQYCYTISAYDAAGNISGQSGQACATTEDTIPPTIPTGLVATAISESQINLSWNASTDNTGISGYRISRNGNQMAFSSSTFYSDTGLDSATRYCYTIVAVDDANNSSDPSNEYCQWTQYGEVWSRRIGDNDGYGYGSDTVPDNYSLPTSDHPEYNWFFDNRDNSDYSGEEGSNFTDNEPVRNSFSFTITFPPVDSSFSGAEFILDVSGIQTDLYGASLLKLDDIDFSYILPAEQGTFGSEVIIIPLNDIALFRDGELIVTYQAGQEGIWDAVAFDFFQLNMFFSFGP